MASKKHLVDLDLGGNQIIRAALESLTADPTTEKAAGRIYWNSTSKVIRYWDGAAWQSVTKAADLTSITSRLSNVEGKAGTNATAITDLKNRATALETTVGGSTSGLVKDVADLKDFIGEGGTGGDFGTLLDKKENRLTEASGRNGVRVTPSVGPGVPVMEAVKDPKAGNVLQVNASGLFVPTPLDYTIEKLATPTSGMSASYQLRKGGSLVGAKIDIPKDMVVSKGEVRKATADEVTKYGTSQGVNATDLYIVLTLANSGSPLLFIPAKSLVDIYKGRSGGYVLVDNNNNEVYLDFTSLQAKLKDDEVLGLPTIKSTLSKAVLTDGSRKMTADLDMGTKKVTNLGAPALNTDAATKAYVDTAESNAATRGANNAVTAIKNGEQEYSTLKKVGDKLREHDTDITALQGSFRHMRTTVPMSAGAAGVSNVTADNLVSYCAKVGQGLNGFAEVVVDLSFDNTGNVAVFSWNPVAGDTGSVIIDLFVSTAAVATVTANEA